MSFLTATNTELIYNMPAVGADNAASSAATIMTANSTTNPAAYLPPLYSIWQPSTVAGKGFSIRLGGTFATSAATSNTFVYGLNTGQGTTTIPKILGQTGSAAWGSISTGGIWHAQIDVVVGAAGESGGVPAVNLYTTGFLAVGASDSTTAATVYPLGAAQNTTPTAVSISPITAYYFELVFTWSSTTATHSACQQHMIFGLN